MSNNPPENSYLLKKLDDVESDVKTVAHDMNEIKIHFAKLTGILEAERETSKQDNKRLWEAQRNTNEAIKDLYKQLNAVKNQAIQSKTTLGFVEKILLGGVTATWVFNTFTELGGG